MRTNAIRLSEHGRSVTRDALEHLVERGIRAVDEQEFEQSGDRGVGSQKQVGLAVSASVSSYAESDAKALIALLKAAVAACGTGFSATVEKQTGSYREVRAADYRTSGDESVSWTTTAAAQGVSAQVHLVVVREGDTVVRLMALNVAAGQQKAQVPQEVADKQLEKVRRAG